MQKNDYSVTVESARLLDNSLAELMLYTKKPEAEVVALLRFAMDRRNEEWSLFSSISILNYHRATEFSLYCLTKWNVEERYQKIMNYIVSICKVKNGTVFDFGGGVGELSIALATNSIPVDFMEVPGNTFNYAQWRFKRRFLDINTYTTLNDVKKTYDVIICLDVFEVLEKPLAHLKKFYKMLNENGILIFSVGEVGSPYHPMNLPSNKDFLAKIDSHCDEVGFKDATFFENRYNLKIKEK